DLQDKKITLPVLCAFRSADDKEKKKITKMIKNGAAKKDLGYILDFVNRYNGLESARDKSFEIKDKAVAALAPLSETPAKQSLIDLADFVVNRSK
ncbi:MAG: polyprenyl synthetase family protein, partial [Calditrichia bacterium]